MTGNGLIDSCVWIEYFGDGPKANDIEDEVQMANPSAFYTPTVVLLEVYRKIKKDVGTLKALEAYAEIAGYTRVVPLTEDIAMRAADICLERGFPTIDAIILATAEKFGAKIVTMDKHFKGLKNVNFIA